MSGISAVKVIVPPPGEAAEAGAAAVASPVESAGAPARARHFVRMSRALIVLAVIAVIATLYLARAFLVPLLIGILASYTLRPIVDWLQALRIPRAVGAALVLAVLVGGGRRGSCNPWATKPRR